MTQSEQNRRKMANTLIVIVVVMGGFLTLAVILAAMFGGLWLDNQFGTKPVFTLALSFAGIPLSVILMLFVARKTLARLTERYENHNP